MKAQSRILGVDDAPFTFADEFVPVVGVVVRAPSYVEGVLTTRVHVDGTDATEVVAAAVNRSRYRKGLALILLDGSALGGFNVLDIDALHESTGVPVATVTRERPDLEAMTRVLRRKFPDWERRFEILRRKELVRVETPHKPLYATMAGLPLTDLKEAIHRCTVRGALPEPVRIAHLIATSIVKGESKGNA